MTARITFTGNATDAPELRFGKTGTPWATVTVAVTPREKDAQGNWGDGEAAFYRVACFGSLAENAAESITRGMRVNVDGVLKPRSFEHNGEKRMSLDVTADSIGPDLRFSTASVTKAQRQQGGQQQQPAQGGNPWGGRPQQPDPWAGQQAGTGGGWGGQQTEGAPF